MTTRVKNTPIGVVYEDGEAIALKAGKKNIRLPFVLANDSVPKVAGDVLTEQTLFQVTIPGGTMGPNGSLCVDHWFRFTGSGNKVIRIRLGGVLVHGFTASSTWVGSMTRTEIKNRNSETSQICPIQTARVYYEQTSGSYVTTAINTAVDQVLSVNILKSTAVDVASLESVRVEILPGFI